MKKEAIYDLDNSHFLFEDIEFLFDQLSTLYEVDFQGSKTIYTPKTSIPSEFSWSSDECKKCFNKMIPKIKSLTKDMYSTLECIFISKNGKFHKLQVENRFNNLKELRLLNNKFKHFKNQEAEISLTSLVLIQNDVHLLDCYVNFKYLKDDQKLKCLRFSELVDVFLKILKTENIIGIDRG